VLPTLQPNEYVLQGGGVSNQRQPRFLALKRFDQFQHIYS
jgi:hypothetical protein